MTTPPSQFSLPQAIADEAQLDDLLSRPRPELVEFIRQVRSPLLVLGAGGKMGPRWPCWRAAPPPRRDTNSASSPSAASATPPPGEWLETRGVETISCDLFDREAVARLPEAADILYLVGVKFGTSQNPSLTWAANTIIPTNVAERFPEARMVALSTGNVYPMVPIANGGARRAHPLTPLGEYANAAVARERLFEFHSRQRGDADGPGAP